MADLGISISLNSTQYTQGLSQVTAQTNAAAQNINKSLGTVSNAANEGGKAMQAFTSNLGGLGNLLGGGLVVGAATLAAQAITSLVGSIVDLGKESIQVASDVQTVNRALAFTAGSAEEGAASYDRFKDVANGLGISIEKNQKAFKNFVVSATQSGQTMEAAETEFRQVATAITAMGLSAEDSNGVLLALGQIASKGTVSAEELRGQIGERLPGAFAIAARSIGVTESKLNDMLQKGQVVSKDFLPQFTAELERTFGASAQEGVNSYAAQLNRFNNKLFELKVTIGEALIPAANNLFAIFTKTGEALGLIAKESAKSSTQISDGLILQKEKLQDLVFAITNVNKGEDVRKELISQLNAEYPTFLKGLNAETASNEELFQRLDKVNDAYDKKIKLQVAQESLMSIEKELKALETQRFDLLKAEADLLRRSASTKKETGFVSAAQLQNQNTLQKNANDFTRQATDFTKDQITQKKLELSYQEELVKEYLKGSKGLTEILGITENGAKATAEGVKGITKATKELAQAGSLGDLENQLKSINDIFQNKTGFDVAKLTGRKEDLEAQIKRLKELYGLVKTVPEAAAGSLSALQKQFSELNKQINESPNDINLLSALQKQAISTQAQIKEVENAIKKAKRLAETGGVFTDIFGVSEGAIPKQGQIAPAENLLIAPKADTSGLDNLISKLNEVDDKVLGTQRQLIDSFQKIKDSAFQSLGDGLANVAQTFGNSIGQLITGVATFEEVMKNTLLSLGQAILVELPKVVGMGLVQSAFSPVGIASFPANIPLALAGLALIGASGLIGGLLSGLGGKDDTIASQTASAGQIGGTGTTAQATAQGLGSNSAANTQAVTNVTVVLNTNGIVKEIDRLQYVNGLLVGG